MRAHTARRKRYDFSLRPVLLDSRLDRSRDDDGRRMSVREWLGLEPTVVSAANASVSGAGRLAFATQAYHRIGALWTSASCKLTSIDRETWAQAGPLLCRELAQSVRDAPGRWRAHTGAGWAGCPPHASLHSVNAIIPAAGARLRLKCLHPIYLCALPSPDTGRVPPKFDRHCAKV